MNNRKAKLKASKGFADDKKDGGIQFWRQSHFIISLNVLIGLRSSAYS